MKMSFCITGALWGEYTGHFLYHIPLWGESIGHRWISSQRTCSTDNWCLFVVVSLNEPLNKHSKWSVKLIALTLIWYHPNNGKIRERCVHINYVNPTEQLIWTKQNKTKHSKICECKTKQYLGKSYCQTGKPTTAFCLLKMKVALVT